MEKNIDRREFLKRMGAGAAVIGATSALNSCSGGAGYAMIENIDPAGSGTKPIGDMTYRINHECGDKVSILGYGCMRWPNDPKTGVIDQETVNRLVDTAIEHGVNYFDTSPAYLRGLSERSTGIALKRHPRDKYFIATKLSNFAEQQKSREASIALYNKSFTELQVDYIDYMLLHSIGGSMEDFNKRYIRNGILDFLVGEKKKGKIRNLGFSYHGDNTVFDHVMKMHDEGQYHWDFVQIQMNYVDWRHAKEVNELNLDAKYLYETLAKLDIPVVIMEPLLGGRLARYNYALAQELTPLDPESTLAKWAFRFCGTFPKVMTVLSGMTRTEHIEENLVTFSPLKPCSEKELAALERAAQRMLALNTIPCNSCNYCMPCPYGLDIVSILQFRNSILTAKTMPSAKEVLKAYAKAVPEELRRADHCTGCGRCTPHCPQSIDIPRESAAIDEWIDELKNQEVAK